MFAESVKCSCCGASLKITGPICICDYCGTSNIIKGLKKSDIPKAEVVSNSPSDSLKGQSVDAEILIEAGCLIIESQKASIGVLQRKLKLGFNTAARIMDNLEELGVVGPEEGTKPRKILMSIDEFHNLEGKLRIQGFQSKQVPLQSIASSQEGMPDPYLVEEAGRIILEEQRASIGLLQRRLKVGFNHACSIMDKLEELGVVGPENGTKPRMIIMSLDDFNVIAKNI